MAAQISCRVHPGDLKTSLITAKCDSAHRSLTEQRDAMLTEPPVVASVQVPDLKEAVLVDRVAKALKTWDAIEYWKSSPYLLNVMREYELKRHLATTTSSATSTPTLPINAGARSCHKLDG